MDRGCGVLQELIREKSNPKISTQRRKERKENRGEMEEKQRSLLEQYEGPHCVSESVLGVGSENPASPVVIQTFSSILFASFAFFASLRWVLILGSETANI